MDSGRPPDTNVVRLRRNGDLTDEERKQLASTIFAEQDEVGTFSRGNLVPPKAATPPSGDDSPVADGAPSARHVKARRGSKLASPAVWVYAAGCARSVIGGRAVSNAEITAVGRVTPALVEVVDAALTRTATAVRATAMSAVADDPFVS